MTWTWDAPSGVYKNHALSSKLRYEAVERAVFSRFVTPEPGFGRGRGDTVNVTRVRQLPIAGRVSETDRLPTGRPAIDTKSVTVSEWGFAAEMTNFEEMLAHHDLPAAIRRMLRDQMSITMDKMIADALKTTPVKAIPGDASSTTFDTDGTASTQAASNWQVIHLREIHDYLSGTLKSPPFRNGQYIGILSTKAARGIKNDPEYKDWLAPTQSQPFVTGMLPAQVEGFSLVETNHFNALDNDIGASGVAGEALFFGADAGFLAEVQSPEIRVGMAEDLGRFNKIGWYGILEAGLTWDAAAEARVVHGTSS